MREESVDENLRAASPAARAHVQRKSVQAALATPAALAEALAVSNARVRNEIESLENKFWQSMIDHEPAVATARPTEPALMVSGHGSQKFDHAGYTKVAKDERSALLDYKIPDFEVVSPSDDVAAATHGVHQVTEAAGLPRPLVSRLRGRAHHPQLLPWFCSFSQPCSGAK